ncbi:MAG: hypothetical protein H6739_28045 [Alphaproteobacteria bacterium]|nr:hypothetical protein [Alphaproteobacteria bacterium]
MPVRVLVVPVHLDALVLDAPQNVVRPTADFTRLPWTDGQRDHNSDVANLAEAVAAQPFQDLDLVLQPGVHLHWALPDALTEGAHSDEGARFPAAPNRWMVIRRSGSAVRRWMVESDVILSEDEADASGSTVIPVPRAQGGRPHRHLGRAWPFEGWSERQAERLQPLTAAGYGDPKFAAFYPDCHTVFGFHDAEVTAPDAAVTYTLVGWYLRPDDDPITALPDEGWLQGLQERWSWTVAEPAARPQRSFYVARLSFEGGAATDLTPPQADTVALGRTSDEALAADLAARIDGSRRAAIEDWIEALGVESLFADGGVDVGARLREARHAASFVAHDGGLRWAIHVEPLEGAPADAAQQAARAGLRPPDDLQERLDPLNGLQQAYDRAAGQLAHARAALFADWSKLMLATYPLDGGGEELPSTDLLRYFIAQRVLPEVEALAEQVGALTLDDAGAADAGDSAPGSLAARLAALIAQTTQETAAWSATLEAQGAQAALRGSPSSRFWQPREPAVLITGPAVEATVRHQQDGRLHPERLLTCGLWDDITQARWSSDGVLDVDRWLDGAPADVQAMACHAWSRQPWHPLLLQWEAELYPTLAQDLWRWGPDAVTAAYDLPADATELHLQDPLTRLQRGPSVYTGVSVLSPHASGQLQERLTDWAKQRLTPRYLAATGVAEADQPAPEENDAWFEANQEALLTWAAALTDPNDPAPALAQALRTLSEGYLAQSQELIGFNQALLQHREGFQLPIADPLAFPEDVALTERVAAAVGSELHGSVQAHSAFHPVRAGSLRLRRLRLVDNFGRVQDLDVSALRIAHGQSEPDLAGYLSMPPRLVQPARLQMRWLAGSGEVESDSHPDRGPICGWVVPNNLDGALFFFDADGRGLGLIDADGHWAPAPGSDAAQPPQDIADPTLRRFVQTALGLGEGFVVALRVALDSAQARIEPAAYAQHAHQVMLIGQPLALVRARLDLRLQGLPAVDHSWNALRLDMQRPERADRGFPTVRLPVRLGEHGQLDDGVVGFFIEEGSGYREDTFYAPQSDAGGHDKLKTAADTPAPLALSLEDEPLTLCVLMDPRGKVHLTSGALPTKVLDIPPERFVDALARIEVSFQASPLLSVPRQVALSLPAEEGLQWRWLGRRPDGGWIRLDPQPTVARDDFLAAWPGAEAIRARLLSPEVAWLTPTEQDGVAAVVSAELRSSQTLGGSLAGLEPAVERALAAATQGGQVAFADLDAALPTASGAWATLAQDAVGWLAPQAGSDDGRLQVVPPGHRTAEALGADLTGLEPFVQRVLDRVEEGLVPFRTVARFEDTPILRDGWISLRPTT